MGAEMAHEVETQTQRIDALIQEHGFCLMKEEQLKVLFPDEDCSSKRFLLLANLACEYQWSFEFEPRDGAVRIALLPPLETAGSSNGAARGR
jgi:hypothetical protein